MVTKILTILVLIVGTIMIGLLKAAGRASKKEREEEIE